MNSEHEISHQQHLVAWQGRLQDLIDQSLSATETVQVQAHLSSCVMCTHEHRRLLIVDNQLRSTFAAVAVPSAEFEQRLFADIAVLEQDKRAKARQREQQEYAKRLAQLRFSWHELLRFQLGNIIAAVATLGAVVTAVVSAWPTISGTEFIDTQVAELPFAWVSPLFAVSMVSIGVAAVAIWFHGTRRRR